MNGKSIKAKVGKRPQDWTAEDRFDSVALGRREVHLDLNLGYLDLQLRV